MASWTGTTTFSCPTTGRRRAILNNHEPTPSGSSWARTPDLDRQAAGLEKQPGGYARKTGRQGVAKLKSGSRLSRGPGVGLREGLLLSCETGNASKGHPGIEYSGLSPANNPEKEACPGASAAYNQSETTTVLMLITLPKLDRVSVLERALMH